MMSERPSSPTADLAFELAACDEGFALVAGVDEAGRGAWAGPVVAAAVILCRDLRRVPGALTRARDSKVLSPAQREELFAIIRGEALAIGVGVMPVELIDEIGVGRANRRAMRAAVEALGQPPELLLVDYERLPEVAIPQRPIVDGDAKCLSIAAASIVAKVTRDRLMADLDGAFPAYGFAAHKGYGTRAHRAALARHGPCPAHRRSFAPIAQLRLDLIPGADPPA